MSRALFCLDCRAVRTSAKYPCELSSVWWGCESELRKVIVNGLTGLRALGATHAEVYGASRLSAAPFPNPLNLAELAR